MNVKEALTSVIQMLNVVIQLGAMSASAELAMMAMESIVQVCSCRPLCSCLVTNKPLITIYRY